MSENKVVKDALGRELHIKEMDPADQLDLFEACAEHSTNPAWTGMALLVCSVTEIDDVPVPMPKNPKGVKDLARKLGKEGVAAVAQALSQPKSEDDEPAVDQTVATAKN